MAEWVAAEEAGAASTNCQRGTIVLPTCSSEFEMARDDVEPSPTIEAPEIPGVASDVCSSLPTQAIRICMVTPELSPGVAALTHKMAALDESAFVQFHGLYHARLFRYAFVLARGHVDVANDLVQETMLRVVRHIRRFEDESAFWQWLTRIVRSVAADHGRKLSRWQRFIESWAGFLRTAVEEYHPEDGKSDADVLDNALATIDASDAAILRSKYFDGTSVREIARQYETSEKAIESRLTRARQALRSQLERMNRQEQER